MVSPELREKERIDRLEKELRNKNRLNAINKRKDNWYSYSKPNKKFNNRFMNQDDADFASAFDWGSQ